MAKNYYLSGDHNVICDVCSRKIKMSEAKLRWDGFLVCKDDFEMRHPQDFIRSRQDKISVEISRPRPVDVFRLRYVLIDSILITDDEVHADYLLVLSDYFSEDFLKDYIAIKIDVTWNRSFTDEVNISELVGKQTGKSLDDSVTITEYIYPRKTITRTFEDTFTLSDTGTIFWENYVDSTYFAEHYVGTYVNFIS